MEVYSVRNIPRQGVNLDKKLEPDWLETHLNHGIQREELTVSAVSVGRVALNLRKIDPEAAGEPGVKVSGGVEAKIKAHCVRCLAKVELNVQGNVNQMLFPAPSPQQKGDNAKSSSTKNDDEIALLGNPEDLDDDTYHNQEIDLPSIIRESILLELDMNTVCDDEDRCETRTQKLLASASSQSSEAKIDPRWAALEKIQLKTE